MYCLNCGAEMAEGSRFCNTCGADNMPIGEQPTQMIGQQPTQQYGQAAAGPYGYGQQQYGQQQYGPYGQMPPSQPTGYGNDPNDPLYYGAPMTEREAKRAAKAQMKEAKTAYDDARRAAGKSSAPKIIAIAVAVLVVTGAAAGATWWFMSGNASGAASSTSTSSSSTGADDGSDSDEASSESAGGSGSASGAASSQAASSASSASSAAVSSASAASSSSASGGLASYVGSWKGEFVEQSRSSGHRCYGAEKVPIELTITDVGNSGRVTANVKVVYHEHASIQDADVQSSSDDAVLEIENLVGTIDSAGRWEFVATFPDSGGKITLAFTTVDQADGSRTLQARVTSAPSNATFTDDYVLSK